MRILVATRNRSKYIFVADWLRHLNTNIQTTALYDTGLQGDVEETGTIEERARQKAHFYRDALLNSDQKPIFDAVLGIDDGIQVADGEPTPNSKEMTDDILCGKWPIGTPVHILRAYMLVQLDGTEKATTAKLRFTFVGNPDGVIREEGIYPLEQVLAPEGYNVPWSKMTESDIAEFTKRHAPQLKPLFAENDN